MGYLLCYYDADNGFSDSNKYCLVHTIDVCRCAVLYNWQEAYHDPPTRACKIQSKTRSKKNQIVYNNFCCRLLDIYSTSFTYLGNRTSKGGRFSFHGSLFNGDIWCYGILFGFQAIIYLRPYVCNNRNCMGALWGACRSLCRVDLWLHGSHHWPDITGFVYT